LFEGPDFPYYSHFTARNLAKSEIIFIPKTENYYMYDFVTQRTLSYGWIDLCCNISRNQA